MWIIWLSSIVCHNQVLRQEILLTPKWTKRSKGETSDSMSTNRQQKSRRIKSQMMRPVIDHRCTCLLAEISLLVARAHTDTTTRTDCTALIHKSMMVTSIFVQWRAHPSIRTCNFLRRKPGRAAIAHNTQGEPGESSDWMWFCEFLTVLITASYKSVSVFWKIIISAKWKTSARNALLDLSCRLTRIGSPISSVWPSRFPSRNTRTSLARTHPWSPVAGTAAETTSGTVYDIAMTASSILEQHTIYGDDSRAG